MPLEKLPDIFSQFFLDKVENIRDQLDFNTPVNFPSPFSYDTVDTLTSFKPITADSLRSLLKKSSPKSCALDPVPTPLLFECLNAVMPVLTNSQHFLNYWNMPINLQDSHCKTSAKKAHS